MDNKGAGHLCLLHAAAANHVEFRECNTKRKRKRELNGLLFLKKKD